MLCVIAYNKVTYKCKRSGFLTKDVSIEEYHSWIFQLTLSNEKKNIPNAHGTSMLEKTTDKGNNKQNTQNEDKQVKLQ